MLCKQFCRDFLLHQSTLLRETKVHYEQLLEGKEQQYNQSLLYTDLLLEEKDRQLADFSKSNKMIIDQNGLHLEKARNLSQCFSKDRNMHISDLQTSLRQQRDFLFVFAVGAGIVVLMLAVLVCCLFHRQEQEKRNLNRQYESVIQEKTERICRLEQKQEHNNITPPPPQAVVSSAAAQPVFYTMPAGFPSFMAGSPNGKQTPFD